MRTLLLLATLIAAAQDTEVVRILRRFVERRDSARSQEEFHAAARDAVASLDAFVAKAKAQDPDLPRAAFHACEMHLFLGDVAKAYERFEGFVKNHGDAKELAPTARFLLGELSLQLAEDARAREKFAEFVKAHPSDPRVFGAKVLSAMSYANEKRYDDAVAGLAALRREAGSTAEGWGVAVQLAITLHLAERNDDARAGLEEVIKNGTDLELVERCKRLLADWWALGKPVADFEGKDVAGAAFRRPPAKVTLLYIFTVTFEHAAAEVALMRGLRDRLAKEDFALLGVAVDRKQDDVERFVKQHKIDWPVCVDGNGFDGPLALKLGVKSLPFVMIVDRKGTLRFFNPIYTPGGREVVPLIQKLLAEK
jgi:TolA-binding protein